jgi:NAD(P)H-dependent flavin oxidoreductase YrpB (nitropropane dioxygenase family)
MLKTRITERYGLKVPFINAGMAFVATAPLVRAVGQARLYGQEFSDEAVLRISANSRVHR